MGNRIEHPRICGGLPGNLVVMDAFALEQVDVRVDILKAEALIVTKATGVPLCVMQSRERFAYVNRARRQLSRSLRARGWTLCEIGNALGRHHSTILYLLNS